MIRSRYDSLVTELKRKKFTICITELLVIAEGRRQWNLVQFSAPQCLYNCIPTKTLPTALVSNDKFADAKKSFFWEILHSVCLINFADDKKFAYCLCIIASRNFNLE